MNPRPYLRSCWQAAKALVRPLVRYIRDGRLFELEPSPCRRPIVPPSGKRFPPKRISALLTNFNHAQYLEKALTSVCTQSRPPDEYWVLDDASTDNSVEIIERFAERYPFIHVVRKIQNIGHNRGITELAELATGDYIHSGAADDCMLPGFIEGAMALAEEFPHAGIISAELLNRTETCDSTSHISIKGWTTGYVSPEKYLHEYLETDNPCCTLAPATLFRRDAFLAMGGMRDELGTWAVSFVLQACALRYGMCYLNRPGYSWYSRTQGWTRHVNADFDHSVEYYKNYLRLMRTPPFRNWFSELFARVWFSSNVAFAARCWGEALADELMHDWDSLPSRPEPIGTEAQPASQRSVHAV